MRIKEILIEARESPLYHFTTENGLFKILASNKLRSKTGKIYFTRDYSRQFSPVNILKGTWGISIDQDLLHRVYGKKLQAGGQLGKNYNPEEALKDPKIASAVQDYLKYGDRGLARVNGVDIKDLAKGSAGANARWESEEWLFTDKVENLDKYITGIIYAGGNITDPKSKYRKRNPNLSNALEDLALELIGNFSNKMDWEKRDWLMNYMNARNIPFVYQRQNFSAKQVKSKMFEIWKNRKEEKERRSKENPVIWIMIKNSQGGGISYSAPADDPIFAAKRALKDMPTMFPDGIFGAEMLDGNKNTWMFDKPYKDPTKDPVIKVNN
jgi:hypothetical protein